MTNAEFVQVLVTLASLPLGGEGLATGFFTRLAQGAAARYISTTAIKQFLVKIVAELFTLAAAGGALNSDIIKEKILEEVLKHTGLEIETLDKEGAKKAIGKLIADNINLKYGTNFAPFYPLENIIDDIKAQLLTEILTAVE